MALVPGGPAAAGAGPLVDDLFPGGLPYPFEAVLDRLAAEAGAENVATALVPVGRSLQRYAAHPDYFASPRVVVAVTGDAGGGPGSLRLADRLYLGYQPAAGVVEAISYDAAAGRFAFAEFVGYGPEGPTEGAPAEPRVCLACHQGAGPIFARPLWSETNGNPAVAERMAALGARFEGAPVRQSVDALEAFDAATDRAALVPVAARLWAVGCADAGCRAALLAAAIRVGLGAEAPAAPEGFAERTARLWPKGIGGASPDLPNRDPLPVVDSGADIQAAGPFDPETPRDRRILWAPGADGFAAAARAVAAEFSLGDLAWIDGLVAGRRAAPESVALACKVTDAALPTGARETRFTCAAGASRAEGFRRPDGSGRVDSLVLAGLPAGSRLPLGTVPAARLPDGRRLEAFGLAGSGARLRLVDDLAGLPAALAAADRGALGPGTFRREAVLDLIAAALGKTDG